MEMSFPAGPPSYEATMSATLNVNPGFEDGSVTSIDIPANDDLPPAYDAIASDPVVIPAVQAHSTSVPAEAIAERTAVPVTPSSAPSSAPSTTGAETNDSAPTEAGTTSAQEHAKSSASQAETTAR